MQLHSSAVKHWPMILQTSAATPTILVSIITEKKGNRMVRQLAFPEKGKYSAKMYTGREEMLRDRKQFIF